MSSEVPIFIQVDSGSDVEAMALGHVTVLHFSGGQAWEC